MSRAPLSSTIAMLLGMMLAAALARGQQQAPGRRAVAAEPGTAAAPAEAPIRYDATTMVLPARRLALKELIDATAGFLHLNILSAENELQLGDGGVALQSSMSLTQQAAEEVVCDLLYSRGFILAPRDAPHGIYEVIYRTGPRMREVQQLAQHRTPEEILQRPQLKQPVSTILQLQAINAVIATNALRPFFAAAGAVCDLTFGATGGEQTLVISGTQSEVARAIRIVQQADAAAAAAAAPKPGLAPAEAEVLGKRIAALEQEIARLGKVLGELQQRLPAK